MEAKLKVGERRKVGWTLWRNGDSRLAIPSNRIKIDKTFFVRQSKNNKTLSTFSPFHEPHHPQTSLFTPNNGFP